MSAVVPSGITGLEAAAKKFAEAAMALNDPNARLAYRQAMKDVIRYNYVYCADLYNFAELVQQDMAAGIAAGKIAGSQNTRALDAAAEDVKSYITNNFVLYNFTAGTLNGVAYSKSRGISVYIPAVKSSTDTAAAPMFLIAPGTLYTRYTDLQFDKATGWSNFAKYLTIKDTPPAAKP